MDWLSIISYAVTAAVGIWQARTFLRTRTVLSHQKDFFPSQDNAYHISEDDRIQAEATGEISSLVDELNQYISTNKGTADFSIMQNKTERRTESAYEEATARLSFPTYIGLMGTFLGVLLGLIGFSYFGDEETRVDNLVKGVMVSMITSLVGLVLTTRGNHLAAEAKTILDQRKNHFYDFLQQRLMPSLGTSMVAALDRLRETLGTFEPTFSSVILNFKSSFTETINLFHDTFDECTKNFGSEFRDNSKLLNQGVEKMAQSVELINSNVDNQRQLLEEIRSTQMWNTLTRFIEAANVLEQAAIHIESLRGAGEMLNSEVQSLMKAQEEYVQSLVVPKLLAERINNLLDRISTFEEHVNNIGPAIDTTELIGVKDLSEIKAHLDKIEWHNTQIKRYTDMQTEEMENFFKAQKEAIERLSEQYRALLDNHGEQLADVMETATATLEEKRAAFLRSIDEAFDAAEISTQFSHLSILPRLEALLNKLEAEIGNSHGQIATQIANYPTHDQILSRIEQLIVELGKSQKQMVDDASDAKWSDRIDGIRQQLNDIKSVLSSYDEAASVIASVHPSRLNELPQASLLLSQHDEITKLLEKIDNTLKRQKNKRGKSDTNEL